jgi:hypothetical protein
MQVPPQRCQPISDQRRGELFQLVNAVSEVGAGPSACLFG